MLQLEINLDNNNYLPGNEVSGSLILEVDKATNIRSLNLTVSTGKSSVTYHDENNIIDIQQLFSDFQIKIPENYNPSFEGSFSNNIVYLRFYLDIRWAQDIFVEFPITVNRL